MDGCLRFCVDGFRGLHGFLSTQKGVVFRRIFAY